MCNGRRIQYLPIADSTPCVHIVNSLSCASVVKCISYRHYLYDVNYLGNGLYLYDLHIAANGGYVHKAMTDSEGRCVLSLQRFPRELKKRLKMKALEREVDLQELCIKYLEAGLAKDESRTPSPPTRK